MRWYMVLVGLSFYTCSKNMHYASRLQDIFPQCLENLHLHNRGEVLMRCFRRLRKAPAAAATQWGQTKNHGGKDTCRIELQISLATAVTLYLDCIPPHERVLTQFICSKSVMQIRLFC